MVEMLVYANLVIATLLFLGILPAWLHCSYNCTVPAVLVTFKVDLNTILF